MGRQWWAVGTCVCEGAHDPEDCGSFSPTDYASLDIQQAGRSAKLATVSVEYTCAHSGCCSSVTLCPYYPASLLFILHFMVLFMVYWSRRYPQFPVSRDRHPIPHRLSPCHYQSLCVLLFSSYDYPIEAMSLLCIQDRSCGCEDTRMYPIILVVSCTL